MLIPSIDLQGGHIVQLVQGERLALATDDFEGWIARFARFPKVQLIDLDAAKRAGDNSAVVRAICQRLPCRVGGGLRTVERAREVMAHGAQAAIVGSSLFDGDSVDVDFAARVSDAVGVDRLIAAVDARGGRITIHGWRTTTSLAVSDAIRQLEPFAGEFLFTNVDVEGLMQGIDRDAIRAVRDATTRRVTAAGGVTTREEIDWLDGIGVDAVAGMAIYTGRLDLGAVE